MTIEDIDVMCVVADGGPAGGPAAFAALEAPLTTLRGRRFYATYRGGEYRACVAVQPGGDPEALGLSPWRIPGGEYERRRVAGWQDQVDSIGATFDGMVPAAEVDGSRPLDRVLPQLARACPPATGPVTACRPTGGSSRLAAAPAWILPTVVIAGHPRYVDPVGGAEGR